MGGMGGWCDKSFQGFWGDNKNNSLTQKARSGEPFRYLEYARKVNRRISRDLWKKVLVQKKQVVSDDFKLHFFKISIFSLFLTYNPIVVSYGHDIFYWRKEKSQADLSDILNMFVKLTKNFLGALEKLFQHKKWERNIRIVFWTSFLTSTHFLGWTFFSRGFKKFSADFTNMFKVSGRSA